MFASKDLFFSKPSGYQISRSLRFRSSATAYLNRTFGTPTNEKIWTWSAWVKRGSIGILSNLFSASTGASPAYDGFRFNSSDQLQFFTGGAVTVNLVTTAVFRDPSAWYHVVLSYNATTTTVTIYVNGVAQTTTGTTVSNTTYSFNHASTLHSICAQVVNGAYTAGTYFDGYLTEVNFIDGQALTPSSFGQTNTITGVWQPLKYTGTYGTNGFYLNFSDNSAATAAAIGKDYSGNGNNWTPNNISVTAGATYDSMLDVPTLYADGGNGRGNYCTLNPLIQRWAVASATFSEANLKITTTGASTSFGFGTQEVSSGKWYWEVLVSAIGTSTPSVGVATSNAQDTVQTNSVIYVSNGQKQVGGSTSAYGASYTTNDIIGIALDCDGGTITFYKNNTSQGSISLVTSVGMLPHFNVILNSVFAVNFGQRPFTYTPPSGFVALNTQNLPNPTISNGANYMAASLYSGTSASQSIVNSGNNTGAIAFKPDLVWIKSRSAATDHKLTDSVRGVTKALISDTTGAETTDTNGLTAFNTNGFTVGSDSVYNNGTGPATYVAWQWQAGAGSSSSNTNGSITSTVSVGATQGFSVVTYTGTGANATVGHGLGVAPKMIIIKNRSGVFNWAVYFYSIGAGNVLGLNQTAASSAGPTYFNSTDPTSTVFSVGSAGNTNGSTNSMVAYCFSAVAGYSAFGSYTGNGSADGPFIYTGFRPRWILVKRTDTIGNWQLLDTSRSAYNISNANLYPNLSNAEVNGGNEDMDILSNGFKPRNASASFNISGGTYIFASFAEVPFKVANAR